jgi:hypothetical protein
MNECEQWMARGKNSLKTRYIHVRYWEDYSAVTKTGRHRAIKTQQNLDRHIFVVQKQDLSPDTWDVLCELHKLREDKKITHVPMLECVRESRLVLIVRSVRYFVEFRKLMLKGLYHYLLKVEPVYWKARYGTGISLTASDLVRCNKRGVNRNRTIQSEKLDNALGVIQTKRNVCCVCKENKIETVYVPCGHSVCCKNCTDYVTSRPSQIKCPICRRVIERHYPIYFA